MKQYKGKIQARIEKAIRESLPEIQINWINISEKEALSGGADRCTELLLNANYRPDGKIVANEMRNIYVSGNKVNGEYIRLPQETWFKKEVSNK